MENMVSFGLCSACMISFKTNKMVGDDILPNSFNTLYEYCITASFNYNCFFIVSNIFFPPGCIAHLLDAEGVIFNFFPAFKTISFTSSPLAQRWILYTGKYYTIMKRNYIIHTLTR